jgi:hypothetical protein
VFVFLDSFNEKPGRTQVHGVAEEISGQWKPWTVRPCLSRTEIRFTPYAFYPEDVDRYFLRNTVVGIQDCSFSQAIGQHIDSLFTVTMNSFVVGR